jgi:geranylgeranyl pyrophosphate synthase
VEGDAPLLGKNLFADIREGKLTLPLMKTLERDPALRAELEQALAREGEISDPDLVGRIVTRMRESGALREARTWAKELVAEARDVLAPFPQGSARWALESVADTITTRSA